MGKGLYVNYLDKYDIKDWDRPVINVFGPIIRFILKIIGLKGIYKQAQIECNVYRISHRGLVGPVCSIGEMLKVISDDLNELCMTERQIKKFFLQRTKWARRGGDPVFFIVKDPFEHKFKMVDVKINSDNKIKFGLYSHIECSLRDDMFECNLITPSIKS